MSQLKAPDDQNDAKRVLLHPGTAFVLILIGAGIGIGAFQFTGRSSGGPVLDHQPDRHQVAPHLVRDGERIAIPERSPLREKLVIAAVGEKDIQRTLVLPAVVEADPARLVKIVPPLSGRITSLKVQLGERVVAGQPLVVLDSPDLAAAYADYDKGKVLLDLALKNRDRQRGLTRIGGAALKEQQQAETDYITAEAEFQRAQTRLKQIGVDAETTNKSRTVTVSAPMPGSVIELAAAPGAFWNDPTAALMTVADLSSVWVTANVPEKDTTLIAKGQAVDVAFAAYPGWDAKGEVLFVSDVLDPDSRRTKVRIAFQNPDIRLKPNMFANVSFFLPKTTVPIIPTTALILKNDSDRVFVEVEPWVLEARAVEIAFQQGDQSIVKSGVKAGERVVVKGGVLLND